MLNSQFELKIMCKAVYNKLHLQCGVLDAAKVCDSLLFLTSTQGFDIQVNPSLFSQQLIMKNLLMFYCNIYYGICYANQHLFVQAERLLTAVVSQGMPTVPTFVVAEQGEKNIKKLNEAKKSLLKVIEKKFPDVERLYSVTNSQVRIQIHIN